MGELQQPGLSPHLPSCWAGARVAGPDLYFPFFSFVLVARLHV